MITIYMLLIGRPQTLTDESGSWHSAICRTPISDAVELEYRGLVGDQVADTANHGSLDQAVCCHPLAHYAYWNTVYAGMSPERIVGPGSVGENWTLSHVTEQDVCVGDIFTVGSAQVQISAPRYPCMKQERRVQLPGFFQRTLETLRTGWYLRVLTPGVVQVGETLALEERPHPDLTIQRLNVHMHTSLDPEFAQQLLNVPALSAGWKRILTLKLAKQSTTSVSPQ